MHSKKEMTKTLDQLMYARLSLNQVGEKDIRQRAHEFQELLKLSRESDAYPYFQPLEANLGPEALLNGKKVIMLGSNNYLGLTTHPKVREAAIEAIKKYGTSMTGSRLLNGTLDIHEEFEAEIAEFLGYEAALVFTTGYQVNIGTITALADPNTTVFLDKLNHASMYDAVAMSPARPVFYNHLDMVSLERCLERANGSTQKIVATDGIFSMEGDVAPLPQIIELCQKYNALLIVDDAHAIGTLGQRGEGTSGHFSLPSNSVDVITGTFSKALASTGGYVAASKDLIDFIKHFGRSMIFSASITPPNLAAAKTALNILKSEPERVQMVGRNAQKLRSGLLDMGWEIGEGDTPIIPIMINDDVTTLRIWKDLLEAGVYVNPVVYPAVPPGKSLLRISTIATHSDEHIARALDAFQVVGERYNLLQKEAANAIG